MLIAGPCAIQSREQAFKLAQIVKDAGADVFRAGCFKGQNRPMPNGKREYLGWGYEGVRVLAAIQKNIGIPCSCDMQSVKQAEFVREMGIKYPQVGARNMDSLELLRQFKKIFQDDDTTLILKRGPSSTIDEFIGAAEHLGGADKVILCERGTVHFDRHDYTRYRLDIVGVAELKEYHGEYTVIIDPSHGSGDRNLVPRLATSGMFICDGLMLEVDLIPDKSPTDAPQIIDVETFKEIAEVYNDFLNNIVG